MANTPETICALCKNLRTLRRSHIVPEFMYSAMYDDKHRFHVVSTHKEFGNEQKQKGLREPMLCDACEEALSKYERYVSLLLNGGIRLTHENHTKGITVRGIDYQKLRVFALSILWRASVSQDKFFRQVQLGKHQETLRQIIFSESLPPPEKYGFFLCAMLNEGEVITDLMVQPDAVRIDGHLVYRFVFGGLMWLFFVSSHNPPEVFRKSFLRPDGTLYVHRRELADMGYIVKFGKKLIAMDRFPTVAPQGT